MGLHCKPPKTSIICQAIKCYKLKIKSSNNLRLFARRNFKQNIDIHEAEVLMNLKTLFVQNNFKHINYSEFMDLI